jgi:hypothetical protein
MEMEAPMSDSRTVEPLGARIAHALAERRPQPSSDFAARLERASEPTRPSHMTGVLAVAVAACAILVIAVTGRASLPAPIEWPEQAGGQPPPDATPATMPAATLPHGGKYTANQCGQCHSPAPPSSPASHEPNGSFPLVGGHRAVPCATCHAPNKRPQRDCMSCHTPGSWKLTP